jgi:hypothetical protein
MALFPIKDITCLSHDPSDIKFNFLWNMSFFVVYAVEWKP